MSEVSSVACRWSCDCTHSLVYWLWMTLSSEIMRYFGTAFTRQLMKTSALWIAGFILTQPYCFCDNLLGFFLSLCKISLFFFLRSWRSSEAGMSLSFFFECSCFTYVTNLWLTRMWVYSNTDRDRNRNHFNVQIVTEFISNTDRGRNQNHFNLLPCSKGIIPVPTGRLSLIHPVVGPDRVVAPIGMKKLLLQQGMLKMEKCSEWIPCLWRYRNSYFVLFIQL